MATKEQMQKVKKNTSFLKDIRYMLKIHNT